MWRHTEAVWKNAPYQNATKQVLAYLAHRADPQTHRMRLSHSTIARESGVSAKTVGRAIKTFIENGDLILIRKGSTNQLASEFAMGEKYLTVDTMSTVDESAAPTVDTMGGVEAPTVDTMSTVNGQTIDMVSGVSEPTMDMVSATMDTMSTQRNKKVKSKSKSKTPPISPSETPEERDRRVGRQTNPALDLPIDLAELKPEWKLFQKHRMERSRPVMETEAQVTFENFRAWGIERSRAALKYTTGKGWQGLEQDPKFRQNGAREPAASSSPRTKTFDQIKQENTVAAAQRLMEKYANEQS